jgi:hypothetical protein
MKKITLLCSVVWLLGARDIYDINGSLATTSAEALTIGEGCVVVHNLDNNIEIIISKAYIDNIKGDTALIKFLPFDDFSQNAIPNFKITPTKKDKLECGLFKDRLLVIAPDLSSYQLFKDATTIHPDIFMAHISAKKIASPQKADFVKFCEDYSVGRVVFVIEDIAYYIDAISFKVIKKDKLSIKYKANMLPFYSRIKDIEKPFFSWFGYKQVENYNEYYKKLLEIRD